MRVRDGSLLFSVFLAACGSGPSFSGGVYRDAEVAFRVGDVPSEWHRVEVDDAQLAFRDDHGASVLVNARCKLRADDVPLLALTNQLVMGTTDREYVSEETIPFDQREARHTILRAKLDGVMLVWDLFVAKKDGCVFDFALVAPPERFESAHEAFERFARGFGMLKAGQGS